MHHTAPPDPAALRKRSPPAGAVPCASLRRNMLHRVMRCNAFPRSGGQVPRQAAIYPAMRSVHESPRPPHRVGLLSVPPCKPPPCSGPPNISRSIKPLGSVRAYVQNPINSDAPQCHASSKESGIAGLLPKKGSKKADFTGAARIDTGDGVKRCYTKRTA